MSRLDDKYSRAYDRMVRLGYDNEELDILFYDWSEGADHWDWLHESSKKDIDAWLKIVKEDLENTED